MSHWFVENFNSFYLVCKNSLVYNTYYHKHFSVVHQNRTFGRKILNTKNLQVSYSYGEYQALSPDMPIISLPSVTKENKENAYIYIYLEIVLNILFF